MTDIERMRKRHEATQRRVLAKMPPAMRAATEELWAKRDGAIEVITRCNLLGAVVEGLQRVLRETPAEEPVHGLTAQLLPLLQSRLEALTAEKEQVKMEVAELERALQELPAAEELAGFPPDRRDRAAALIAARDRACAEVLGPALAGAFGSTAGRVFHWQFRLKDAERKGDKFEAELARQAIQFAMPAKTAAEEFVRKAKRKRDRIQAKYKRLLDELREAPAAASSPYEASAAPPREREP